jgi:hypothetical protein
MYVEIGVEPFMGYVEIFLLTVLDLFRKQYYLHKIYPTFRRCTQKCHRFSQYGSRLKIHFTLNEL